jgi:tRNA-Thr(GGU) m(6)t(6)A37 methyltransferase TsaA
MNSYVFVSIGTYRAKPRSSYELPRQADPTLTLPGKIELECANNFEVALEGLAEFDKIWLLFVFDQSKSWKPKVLPPKLSRKVGLFASRSPHRPCPIGMSCVDLVKIVGRTVYVNGADLLDGTPILDIKPYIPLCDSFPDARAGWVDRALERRYTLSWSPLAYEQRQWLALHNVIFEDVVMKDLVFFAGENHYNRIRKIKDTLYIKAYKQWRLILQVDSSKHHICICLLIPGYDITKITEHKQLPAYILKFMEAFAQSIFVFLHDSCNMNPEDLYRRI